MSDQYINGLVLIAMVTIIALAVVMSPHFQARRAQRQANNKRKLAHAGKLTCEEPGCDATATRVTYNGYFCEWDYEPNSKQYTSDRSYITWDHILEHHSRRQEA